MDAQDTRRACAAQTIRLSQWAATTAESSIPPEVLARGARVLADDLAAIIGARDEPEVAAFHRRTIARAQIAEATIFRGGHSRTDRLSAAVANGVAADWLELDEGYRVTACHAGLYVLPALMAEAEATNLPVARMLRALVLGYEIVTRIARTWTQRAMNMQSHGRYSAIGAAAGVALARGVDAKRLCDAITTAATLTGPSPRTHLEEGALSRNVWPAVGAWSGSMAVEWAECGIAGSPNALHDVYTSVLGGTAHPERLTEGLGEHWAILDGYTKIYACCQHLHSAVEAIVDLRPRLLERGALENIASVRVETHPLAIALVNPRPHTTLGAKFSMPHAVAAALATGTGGADAFSASTLNEPTIAQLRERVTVVPRDRELPPPHDRPARVIVALRDGTQVEAECLSAIGGPDRPLPPETVFDKVRALAAPAYPQILPVLRSISMLDHAALDAGWRELVDTFTATG